MERVKKEEFIADLERLTSRTLNVVEFQKKYLVGPRALEVEGLNEEMTPNLAGNLGHLVADDDPRDTEEFKKMQKAELRKLIQLLKNGAPPSELEKINFLADSGMRPPGIVLKVLMTVLFIFIIGIVVSILKLVY